MKYTRFRSRQDADPTVTVSNVTRVTLLPPSGRICCKPSTGAAWGQSSRRKALTSSQTFPNTRVLFPELPSLPICSGREASPVLDSPDQRSWGTVGATNPINPRSIGENVPPQAPSHLRSLVPITAHVTVCVMGPRHQAGHAVNPEAQRSAACPAVETRCG